MKKYKKKANPRKVTPNLNQQKAMNRKKQSDCEREREGKKKGLGGKKRRRRIKDEGKICASTKEGKKK